MQPPAPTPGASPDSPAAAPDATHADDLRLRDAVVGGDAQAAEDLFRRHFDALHDFVHFRAGSDRGAVEDLVQETFLVALDRLDRYDGRSSLHTWMCGIAKNKLRELRRRRRPRPIADLLEEADDEIDAILSRIHHEELPESVLERAETAELVGATLSSLPPDYREALTAKYVDGLSVREIGARGGRSEKATESLLTRSRTAFGRVFSLLANRRGGLA
ncbi:RNA polymerase sigma factor [Engelhardtia mirabilis]|uniref:RNA polymerase sigma factor n=1 Tax=Engelhardtia mirabilis TaxID=2528011 RepID=UPI003AF37881